MFKCTSVKHSLEDGKWGGGQTYAVLPQRREWPWRLRNRTKTHERRKNGTGHRGKHKVARTVCRCKAPWLGTENVSGDWSVWSLKFLFFFGWHWQMQERFKWQNALVHVDQCLSFLSTFVHLKIVQKKHDNKDMKWEKREHVFGPLSARRWCRRSGLGNKSSRQKRSSFLFLAFDPRRKSATKIFFGWRPFLQIKTQNMFPEGKEETYTHTHTEKTKRAD